MNRLCRKPSATADSCASQDVLQLVAEGSRNKKEGKVLGSATLLATQVVDQSVIISGAALSEMLTCPKYKFAQNLRDLILVSTAITSSRELMCTKDKRLIEAGARKDRRRCVARSLDIGEQTSFYQTLIGFCTMRHQSVWHADTQIRNSARLSTVC